jgi:hypothetical protein
MKRRQFNPDKVVGERLIKEARLARREALAREKAEPLPTGEEASLKKTREADITMDD